MRVCHRLPPLKALGELPRRRTDGAFVVDRSQVLARLNLDEAGVKALRRAQGGAGEGGADAEVAAAGEGGATRVEKQWRLVTKKGKLPVAYRVGANPNERYLYVIADALSATPGGAVATTASGERVPSSIADCGGGVVQVALSVRDRQPRAAVLSVGEDELTVATTAPARRGQANAEAIELLAKVLGVRKYDLSLGKGWSRASRVLYVRPPRRGAPAGDDAEGEGEGERVRLDAGEVFERLKRAVADGGSVVGGVGGA